MNVAKKYFHDIIDGMPGNIQSIDEAYDYLFMVKRHEASKKEYLKNGGISDSEMQQRLQDKYAELRRIQK